MSKKKKRTETAVDNKTTFQDNYSRTGSYGSVDLAGKSNKSKTNDGIRNHKIHLGLVRVKNLSLHTACRPS